MTSETFWSSRNQVQFSAGRNKLTDGISAAHVLFRYILRWPKYRRFLKNGSNHDVRSTGNWCNQLLSYVTKFVKIPSAESVFFCKEKQSMNTIFTEERKWLGLSQYWCFPSKTRNQLTPTWNRFNHREHRESNASITGSNNLKHGLRELSKWTINCTLGWTLLSS